MHAAQRKAAGSDRMRGMQEQPRFAELRLAAEQRQPLNEHTGHDGLDRLELHLAQLVGIKNLVVVFLWSLAALVATRLVLPPELPGIVEHGGYRDRVGAGVSIALERRPLLAQPLFVEFGRALT